ncbi:MAG: sodium:calcium antiporter [Streptosporangiales bacterium]
MSVLTYVLLLVAFALLLGGALLFTNAVEWAGYRLNLGSGAVGSILAAVATALPESVIPVVAILTGEQANSIAIGAIIGAPFLLGTLGMFLVGMTAIAYRGRRSQDRELVLHRETTERDLAVFLGFFAAAVVLGIVGPRWLHVMAAVLFVLGYGAYVVLSVRGGGEAAEQEELSDLYFDPTKQDPPRNVQIVLQLLVGLGAIVGGAHLFVTEIEQIAHAFGISALLLALVIAPLATELPEKANSVIWVRSGKDSLALGNITGAMVFQSMLPVAIGMAFTPWDLSTGALIASFAGIVGGLLALVTLRSSRRFPVPQLCLWGVLYVGAIVAIVITI